MATVNWEREPGDVAVSRGTAGPGMWHSGQDRSGALRFQFYLDGPGGDELRVQADSLTGKTPADVLPAIRMAADFVDGNAILPPYAAAGR
ncbi:hypothetical protein ABNF97_33055 [Plantactinospora sp. B6F1]|uniref:hypothetical protein n=1 Tax=Plantactinospora sp. B6F1 TaxID=3158971 RepID=UPI0032D9A7B6